MNPREYTAEIFRQMKRDPANDAVKQFVYELFVNAGQYAFVVVDSSAVIGTTIDRIELKTSTGIVLSAAVPANGVSYFKVDSVGTYYLAITTDGLESVKSFDVESLTANTTVTVTPGDLGGDKIIYRFGYEPVNYAIAAQPASGGPAVLEDTSTQVIESNYATLGLKSNIGGNVTGKKFRFTNVPGGATTFVLFDSVDLSAYPNGVLHICFHEKIVNQRSSMEVAIGGSTMGYSTTGNRGRLTNVYKTTYHTDQNVDQLQHLQYDLSELTAEQRADVVLGFMLGQAQDSSAYISFFNIFVTQD